MPSPLSCASNGALFPPAQLAGTQTPPRPNYGDDQEALLQLLGAAYKEAFDPAMMARLTAVAGLGQALATTETAGETAVSGSLHDLMHAQAPAADPAEIERMRAAWNAQVCYHIPPDLQGALKKPGFVPTAPMGLLRFAAAHLRERGIDDPSAFFQPFRQLVQRGVAVPHDISAALEQGILPFDTFRKLVSAYIAPLPLMLPSQFTAYGWNPAAFWAHGLQAICSPLALSLFDSGRVTADTLLDWAGLKEFVHQVSSGDRGAAGRSAAPRNIYSIHGAKPITLLLANWHVRGSNSAPSADASVANAVHIQDLGKLRLLSDSLVPFEHIRYLVSCAGRLPWPVLADEMGRVAADYAGLYANLQAVRRFYFYNAQPSRMTPEQTQRMERSRDALAPFLIDDGQRQTVDRFLAQGFDETWALETVRAHAADPAHLQAWFAHGDGPRLDYHLDEEMKAAVHAWLSSRAIPPETIALLPRMIQSDMGAERIDRMLVAPIPPRRLEAVFGPGTNTPEQVRLGMSPPDELCERIINGGESIEQLGEAARQDPPRTSDLRRSAVEFRERLRAARHAVEALRRDVAAGSAQDQRCAGLSQAWDGAIAVLNDLLRPSLEDRQQQEPEALAMTLSSMAARLIYDTRHLRESRSDAVPMVRV